MVGKYNVIYGEKPVGQAEVRLEGLYYRIICCCAFAKADLYKIELRCEDQSQMLGTLIPKWGNFVLDRKISKNKILHGKPAFYAIEKCKEIFVPVCDDKPFSYIDRLKTARLEFQNGQLGVVIRKD